LLYYNEDTLKTILLTIICTFSFFNGLAQEEAAVSAAANKYVKYAQDGDGKQLVKMTHNAMIEELGGKKQATNLIEQNAELLAAQGISIIATEIGDPFNRVQTNGKVYFLIPQYITMQTEDGKMKVESFLIAELTGEDWTFINAGNFPVSKLEELLPNVANQLIIPEKTFETIE